MFHGEGDCSVNSGVIIMSILLGSADANVRQRWTNGINHFNDICKAEKYEEFRNTIQEKKPDLVFLHLNLPGLNRLIGVTAITNEISGLCMFVFSNKPNDDEGLALLRLGVRGYANAYMDPRLIEKATELLLQGQMWVGRRLITQFVENTNQAISKGSETRMMKIPTSLTNREQQVAILISQGAKNKQIASVLGIAEHTVKIHLGSIFNKTGAKDRLQLALLIRGHQV